MLHYYAIVFLPLIASLFAGLFGRYFNKNISVWVTSGATLTSAMLSGLLFFIIWLGDEATRESVIVTLDVFRWFGENSLNVNWSLRFDYLSIVMTTIVSSVSLMVHIYSKGYMDKDPALPRFMSYLSFFTFAMLMLVTADNLVQLFFGWEGVGFSSYLLIGFWYKRDSANKAAMKAFLVNRVGDVAFVLGISLIFIHFGSLNFDEIFIIAPYYSNDVISVFGLKVSTITIIGILLVIGAMAKSAQIGFHTWLPDAMEGPTPVSALIHAATMVTAGIFLIIRMSPIIELSEVVLNMIIIVGASTAFMAATIALTQNDIKRVIAYSTCSQLGYMFLATGLSAYPAALFHLFTHAFFKALLFLGAGSVIHAMSNEQDMQKMGGLSHKIPYTYILMWIGTLSLVGMIGFSGYYSKDLILETAFVSENIVSQYGWWLGEATVLLTAIYSFRLMFLTFHGKQRTDEVTVAHIHESPLVMLLPLLFLAIGAVVLGFLLHNFFSFDAYELGSWGSSIKILEHNTAFSLAHTVPEAVKYLPLILITIGILIAWLLYHHGPERGKALSKLFSFVYKFLYNKWYFDELYNIIFVKPALVIGRWLWIFGDIKTIDRFGPDGITNTITYLAKLSSKLHSGKIYHYAITMVAGLILVIALIINFQW